MGVAPVVVGVDQTADARSAVLWAAHEAMLAGAPLLIVHSPARPAAATSSGLLAPALRASDDVGRTVLDAAAALARANEPDVPVNVLLSHTQPAQALIDASSEAQLVVLGARPAAMGDLSLLASKRLLVSAHAHCPVLLLGPVSAFSQPSDVSRIVVGVTDTKAGRAAVAYATAEALRRKVKLHLVRLYQPVIAQPAEVRRQWQEDAEHQGDAEHAERLLQGEVLRIGRLHPTLTVSTHSAPGDAAELLPHYSDGSTLLVVGCYHTDDHWSTRLGPVATSVAHRNRGAVVVVGYSAFLSAEEAERLKASH